MMDLADEYKIDIYEFEAGVVAYDHEFFNNFIGTTS
jgi:hypothetical protein